MYAQFSPFLGICLGLQLLASYGSEHGEHKGLNWIDGKVELMKVDSNDKEIRIPHIGWNNIKIFLVILSLPICF